MLRGCMLAVCGCACIPVRLACQHNQFRHDTLRRPSMLSRAAVLGADRSTLVAGRQLLCRNQTGSPTQPTLMHRAAGGPGTADLPQHCRRCALTHWHTPSLAPISALTKKQEAEPSHAKAAPRSLCPSPRTLQLHCATKKRTQKTLAAQSSNRPRRYVMCPRENDPPLLCRAARSPHQALAGTRPLAIARSSTSLWPSLTFQDPMGL